MALTALCAAPPCRGLAAGVASVTTSSSVAVSIAQTSCPTGNATVAAWAIAVAAGTDMGATTVAIAAVLTSGVDITSTINALFTLRGSQFTAAIQALGAATATATATAQAQVTAAISAALVSIAQHTDCYTVSAMLAQFLAAWPGPATVGQQLCGPLNATTVCPGIAGC